VITVIAILAAVLFPVFAKVREKARQTSCASNLKQLGLAMLMYNEDYDETWMPYGYVVNQATQKAQYWSVLANGDGTYSISAGLVQPYLKSVQVVVCPSFVGTVSYGGGGDGYGYNGGFLGGQFNNTASSYFGGCVGPVEYCSPPGPPVTDAQIAAPSSTIALADAAFVDAPWYGGQNQRIETIEIDPPAEWSGTPTVDYRHVDQSFSENAAAETIVENGVANAFYCDGHVGILRQSTTTNAMFNPY
jgi:type II secretory pathway pseudopilin PulG